MAVPSIASSTTATDEANATSRSINKPSGTASGDWLILICGVDGKPTITAPTGFTTVMVQSDPNSANTMGVYKRKADGSEGASFTIGTSASESGNYIMLRITGGDSTEVIDTISWARGEVEPVTTRALCPLAYSSYDDSLIIRMAAADGAITLTTPGSHTNIANTTGIVSGSSLAASYASQASAGYTSSTYYGAAVAEFNAATLILKSTNTAATPPVQPYIKNVQFCSPTTSVSMTYPKPYGVVDNDLMVALQESDSASSLQSISGFTSIQDTSNNSVIYHSAFYKIASSESGPYTAASSSAAAKIGALFLVWNAATSSPISASSANTSAGASDTSPIASTITPGVNNCLLLATAACDDDNVAWDSGYPSGYTGIFALSTAEGSDSGFMVSFNTQTTAAATGSLTMTLDGAEEWIAFNIAIKPFTAAEATVSGGDAGHVLSSDTATFAQTHVLVIGDATHVLSSDTATFTQAHILTLADVAHVLSSDTATFAQQHILSILDAAMAHEAENATFSQVHTLALADAAHVHAAENVTFTQVHDLTVGDAQHAHAADEVTLGVDLPVDDAAHANTADTVTFAQVHAFTVGNAQHVVESDESTFTQAHTYIVSDAESAHTADNATFTQNHTFVSDSAAHVHTADSVTFAQVHTVAISDATHVLTSDTATFSQIHDVSVDDGTSPHTAENVSLIENYTLNSTDSAHTLSSDTATFTQNHVFLPLNAEHVLTSDEVSLSSEIILMIDDALQAHEAENVTFSQVHNFSPDSAAHAVTSDTATFAQIHILQIQDATHAHNGEEVTFTQNHVVVVADAAHQQTADNVTISQVHAFMIASAVHAMESDGATFTQTHVIDVANSAIALASDAATFTQVHALQVDDALHVFFGEEASIEATGFFVLDGRRIVYVPAHDGTVAGELAGRVVAAARNARLQESPASVRIVKISNTNRTT